MREMRVSLTVEDFKTLVAGGIVRRDGSNGPVAISLQDIGFDQMEIALEEAVNASVSKGQSPK